jgi:fructose-1-phosphate kinase PfkB-like protein
MSKELSAQYVDIALYYNKIFNVHTSVQAHNALLEFSGAVKAAGGNLQETLKYCHKTTGKQLELFHLSQTIHAKGHDDIIVSCIKSGAVDTSSTIWHIKSPEGVNLRFYAEERGATDIVKALDDCNLEMAGDLLHVNEE